MIDYLISPCHYNIYKEVNLIEQISINNNDNPTLIEQLIKRKQKFSILQKIFHITEDSHPKYNSLNIPNVPSKKLKHFLYQQNLKIAYRIDNNLSKKIKNNKTKIPKPSKMCML